MVIEITGTVEIKNVGGAIAGVDLVSRNTVYIRESHVAACIALKEDGPTRLLFSGGGHIDVCGSAKIWAIELRLAELREAAELRSDQTWRPDHSDKDRITLTYRPTDIGRCAMHEIRVGRGSKLGCP